MKYLATIFLALILVLGPTASYAYPDVHQICLETKIIDGQPVCVKTGVKELDNQTIEPPVPVPSVTVPPIKLPDVKVPDVVVPSVNVPNNPPRNNDSGSGSKTVIREKVRSTPVILPKGTVQNKETVVEKPKTIVVPKPSIFDKDPIKNKEIAGKPWYFWTTLVVAGIAIGYMLFYDTEKPKKDKPRHKQG